MDTNKFIPEYRRHSYKDKDRFNPGEIRRRRDEFQVKLRKERQYQLLEKRRLEDTSSQSNSSSTSGKIVNESDSEEGDSLISSSLEDLQTELTQWETKLGSSYDLQERLAAFVKIRQLLLLNTKLVLTEATMKIVFKYLKDYNYPMLQNEAVWIINNLTSIDNSRLKYLIDHNITDILLTLLKSGKCDFECQENIIWTIGNIFGDCSYYRAFLNKHDPDVVNIISDVVSDWDKREVKGITTPSSLWKTTSWTLCNIFKRFQIHHLEQLNMHFITAIKTLLSYENFEVVSNTCWALSYLSKENVETANTLIINSEILPQLTHLLLKNEISVVIPCLRIVGGMTSGTDTQVQSLLDDNILSILKEMLNQFEGNEYILKQILWSISNIVAGTQEQLKLVIQQNIFPIIVKYLQPENAYMVRKEAGWVICNVICRKDLTLEIFQYLILQKFIIPLYQLLSDGEPMLQNMILSTLEIIFKFGGRDNQLTFNVFSSYIEQNCGTDILFDIQTNSLNKMVSNKASHIIDTYFDPPNNDIQIDSNEPSLNPNIEGNRFKFEY